MSSADRPPPDLDLPSRPLTVPLLIRGSFDNGLFFACCAVAILFAVLAFFSWREDDRGSATFLFGIALAAAVPAVSLGLWLRRQREWLEVTLTGFVLSNGGRRRVYSDDQLVGIAQSATPTAQGGLARRLVLIVGADDPERIDCRYRVPSGKTDPLAAFVARLVDGLAVRLERRLSEGATYEGSGWSLDARGLRRGRTIHPLESVTFAGFYDGHLCLWRGDEERPFLRLSEESRNVLPLGALLERRLRLRPPDEPTRLPLGRLLLERSSWGFVLGMIVAALCGLGAMACLAMAAAAPWRGDAQQLSCFAVAFGCGAGCGLILAWYGRFGSLRFHERGLVQTGRWRDARLPYGQIATVWWKKDRLFVFEPAAGLGLPTVRFRTMGAHRDTGLEAMRDRACRPLAERWADAIPRGPVEWTPRLRFLPGGLEYRPMNLLGLLGEPLSVPYDCVSHRVEGEHLLLFVGDEKRPACRERTDGPNFFVGLVVLGLVSDQDRPMRLPDAGEHVPRLTLTGDERVTPGPAENVRRPDAEA